MALRSSIREGGQPLSDIDLDLDQAAFEAEHGTAVELGKHGVQLLCLYDWDAMQTGVYMSQANIPP
jgi:hypothetical protein